MGNEGIVSTEAQVVQPIENQSVEINTPPVDAPVVTPAVVEPTKEETPIAEVAKEVVDATPTVLGEAIKNEGKSDDKPAEVPPTESVQSDEPAPMPTYDAFALPEDFSKDGEGIGDVTKLLGEFELSTKADHAEVQKLGQALVDRHVAEVQKTVERFNANLKEQFENQKNEWKDAFLADPEIGGNRQDTTISSALEFIRTHGGTPTQQAEFHQVLEQSGLGNHPAMIRLLATAARSKEFKEGSPVPAKAPALTLNKYDQRYGKM